MAQELNQNGPGPRRISRRQFVKLAAAAGLLSGCGAAQTPAAAPTSTPTSIPQAAADTPSAQPPLGSAQPSPGTPIPPAPAANPPTPQTDYFPTDTWRTSTPEEHGIDSQGI